MKKIIYIFVLSLISANLYSQKFQAFFNYCQFNTPKNNPYIETYLGIAGKSVKYVKNANNKYQGTVDITLIFRQDSIVKDYKKISLNSPEVDDTININFVFMDLQRFSIVNGSYDFEINIADHNKSKSSFKTTEKVDINFGKKNIELSDIQLLESIEKTDKQTSFSKNGYLLMPYISNFYGSKIDKIKFYSEIYNTDSIIGKENPFLIKYYIKSFETGQIINELIRIKKQQATSVAICLSELPIEKLPSGNYYLCIDIIDKSNSVIASKNTFFQRSNPELKMDISYMESIQSENTFASKIIDKDTLTRYIRSLRPIASYQESYFIDNQLNIASIKTSQKFFYYFWKERSENPEQSWAKYNFEVKKTEKAYSSQIKRGYETDRGRVYLKYGPPNTISVSENEPYNYPYEIWHYYNLGRQSNRKFIFYNPNLVSNDYSLLHSDVIGEIYDPYWSLKLKSRNTPSNNLDDKGDSEDNWGDRSKDLFQNPH